MNANYDELTREELIALVRHQAEFIRSRWHVAPNVEPADGLLTIVSATAIYPSIYQLRLNNGANVYARIFYHTPKPGDRVSVVCGQIKLVQPKE